MARLIGLHGALLLLLTLAGIAVVVYKTHWNDFSSLSHYEALGVPETAQRKDIKRAFRDRSLQYHPDKASSLHSTELSTKRFHRISDAYQVLSDDEARAAYDQQLREQARVRAMQRQSLKVKLIPTTSGWKGALQFYLTEFPFVLVSLALHVMDVRLFFMFLVCLACIVFVFDVAIRVFRKVGDTLFASSPQSTTMRQSNDVAMRAARLRQQQALDAKTSSLLTQRRPRREHSVTKQSDQ